MSVTVTASPIVEVTTLVNGIAVSEAAVIQVSPVELSIELTGKPTINIATAQGGSGAGLSDRVTVDYVTSEIIAAFQVVTVDGRVADSNTVSDRDKILGIATTAKASGFPGQAVIEGQIQNTAWTFTSGDIIYLNGTALSTVAPTSGFLQKIATAITSDKIIVEINRPIRF